jgi:hypothetical protein
MDSSGQDSKNLSKIVKMMHALEESNKQLLAKVNSKGKTMPQQSIKQSLIINAPEAPTRIRPVLHQSPDRGADMFIPAMLESEDYGSYDRSALIMKV